MNKYLNQIVLRKLFVVVLFAWALTASVMLLRLRPQTFLVGIDDNGVRVINDERDRLVAKEKTNLVKRYLSLAYNYESDDYNERITQAGNLMTEALWNEKKAEYKRIAAGLKIQTRTQETKVEDIRLVDDYMFQCDLLITVKNKLITEQVKLRAEIWVQAHKRNQLNPYAWEVVKYAESQRM